MAPPLRIDISDDELADWRAQMAHSAQDLAITARLAAAFPGDGSTNREELGKLERDRAVRELRKRDHAHMRKPRPNFGYAYSNYPHQSSAPAPGCEDDCKICSRSFLCGLVGVGYPYVACPDDAMAQAKVDHLIAETAQHITELNGILDKFGNTIMRKLQKMTVQLRGALLLKAMPGMYRQTGGLIRESDKSRTHELLHRNMYLLPWLNVETLAKDGSLLPALMQHRSTFKPSDFADFDHEQIDYGFELIALAMEYNPHCVRMQGDEFGRLVHWDSDAFHRQEMTSFPRALLTLEAQNTLLKFLNRSATIMVEESKGLWLESGRLKLIESARTSNFRTSMFSTALAATPFSAPPSFDMDSTVDVLQGRVRTAEDDLWLLQTDAITAHDYVSQFDGSMSQAHSSDTRLSRESKLVGRMLFAVSAVENWQNVLTEAKTAQYIMTIRAVIMRIMKKRGPHISSHNSSTSSYLIMNPHI